MKFDKSTTIRVWTKFEARIQEWSNVDEVVEEVAASGRRLLLLKRGCDVIVMFDASKVENWEKLD